MKLCKSISSSESTSFLSIFYFQIIAYKPQKTSEPIKLIGSTLLLKNTPFARDWANSVIFQDVCAFSLNNTCFISFLKKISGQWWRLRLSCKLQSLL